MTRFELGLYVGLCACSGACASNGASAIDGGAGGGGGSIIAVDAGPSRLDDVTVFAFSQFGTNENDPQVLQLAPDMNIRAWQRWDTYGTKVSDYTFSTVDSYHAAGIRLIGGGTASAVFRDEASSDEQFADWVTRDAAGQQVPHTSVAGLHRGSLANPAYRDYLIGIARIQIDGGADGLFFDEVNGSYDGAAYDGNEGYDDYHLADFTSFLLAKYPGANWQSRFGMDAANLPRTDVPTSDLTANFNYRTYLAAKGWTLTPGTAANPLAAEWGRTTSNRPGPDDGVGGSFLRHQVAYVYWKDIVDRVRAYARDTYDRELLITSNGIFPFVDFQSVGLYDGNRDGANGTQVDYVPVTGGHLDGKVSLQATFRSLRAASQAVAGSVPVVLFLDWPTNNLNRYIALPASEREDYWRLYAAEAYANGLAFAFHLKTTTGEPTATDLGMMPFFQGLAAFYRGHAALYHGVTPADDLGVTASAPKVNVSTMRQADGLIVHLVNHNYSAAFVPASNVTVAVPMSAAPSQVTLVSPDQNGDQDLPFTFSAGRLQVTVPQLIAYAALVITTAAQ